MRSHDWASGIAKGSLEARGWTGTAGPKCLGREPPLGGQTLGLTVPTSLSEVRQQNRKDRKSETEFLLLEPKLKSKTAPCLNRSEDGVTNLGKVLEHHTEQLGADFNSSVFLLYTFRNILRRGSSAALPGVMVQMGRQMSHPSG